MNEIEVLTFSTWEQGVSIFGVHTTPVKLLVRVLNKTRNEFRITDMCVSTKNNYLFFETSTDILHTTKTYIVKPLSNFEFEIDVRHIIQNYSSSKKFTIKVTGNLGIYESEKISVNDIQNIKSIYS